MYSIIYIYLHVYVSAGNGLAKKPLHWMYPICILNVCLDGHERYNIFVLQLVAKGGITADVIFNYKVLPQVTTELCYKNSQVRLKNCIGVYHKWDDNRVELYVWYAWRGWCGLWVSHSDINIPMYSLINPLFSPNICIGQSLLPFTASELFSPLIISHKTSITHQ